MRVSGPNRAKTISPTVRKRSGGGGTAFAAPTADEAPETGSVAKAGQISGVDAILALQSVDDALSGKRRAIRRGNDILDQLERLKIDLLSGRIDGERLARLVSLLGRRPEAGDPILDGLTREIELRARVELAKLGVDGA